MGIAGTGVRNDPRDRPRPVPSSLNDRALGTTHRSRSFVASILRVSSIRTDNPGQKYAYRKCRVRIVRGNGAGQGRAAKFAHTTGGLDARRVDSNNAVPGLDPMTAAGGATPRQCPPIHWPFWCHTSNVDGPFEGRTRREPSSSAFPGTCATASTPRLLSGRMSSTRPHCSSRVLRGWIQCETGTWSRPHPASSFGCESSTPPSTTTQLRRRSRLYTPASRAS